MNTAVSQPAAPTGAAAGEQATPGHVSVSDAARLLAQRRSQLRQQTPEPNVAAQEPQPDAPSDEPESDAGTLDESGHESGDSADVTADAQDDVQQDDSTAPDDAVLNLDGEEIPLKQIREWREGALRSEDYQRKTQALSASQQAISTMEQELNRFAHAMNRKFQQSIMATAKDMQKFGAVDWAGLAEKQPQQYAAKKAQFELAKGRYENSMREWQGFLGEYDKLAQEQVKIKAQAALPMIKQRIKGWNDALYSERADFAIKSYGADPGVIYKVTDPWFWEMANDAYAYRNGKQLSKVAAKIVRKSPSVSPARGVQVPRGSTFEKQQTALMDKARGAKTDSEQRDAALEILRARRNRAAGSR